MKRQFAGEETRKTNKHVKRKPKPLRYRFTPSSGQIRILTTPHGDQRL